jgi:hypothetical protein
VALSRIEFPGKAAQIPEEGNGSLKRERERESGMGWGRVGEQGHCWEHMPIQVTAPKCLEKHYSQRKFMRKVSHPRAKFNGRLKPPGWLGKDSTVQTPGQAWLL